MVALTNSTTSSTSVTDVAVSSVSPTNSANIELQTIGQYPYQSSNFQTTLENFLTSVYITLDRAAYVESFVGYFNVATSSPGNIVCAVYKKTDTVLEKVSDDVSVAYTDGVNSAVEITFPFSQGFYLDEGDYLVVLNADFLVRTKNTFTSYQSPRMGLNASNSYTYTGSLASTYQYYIFSGKLAQGYFNLRYLGATNLSGNSANPTYSYGTLSNGLGGTFLGTSNAAVYADKHYIPFFFRPKKLQATVIPQSSVGISTIAALYNQDGVLLEQSSIKTDSYTNSRKVYLEHNYPGRDIYSPGYYYFALVTEGNIYLQRDVSGSGDSSYQQITYEDRAPGSYSPTNTYSYYFHNSASVEAANIQNTNTGVSWGSITTSWASTTDTWEEYVDEVTLTNS